MENETTHLISTEQPDMTSNASLQTSDEAASLVENNDSDYHLTVMMCHFLGTFGAHRLVNKKTASGLAMLISSFLSLIFMCISALLIFTPALLYAIASAASGGYTIDSPVFLYYLYLGLAESLSSNGTVLFGFFLFFFSLLVFLGTAIWALVDLILIMCKKFKNKKGEYIAYRQPFFKVWSNILVISLLAVSALISVLNLILQFAISL